MAKVSFTLFIKFWWKFVFASVCRVHFTNPILVFLIKSMLQSIEFCQISPEQQTCKHLTCKQLSQFC